MPKTTETGKAIKDELPSTLQRSGTKAQQTFAQTYDSAIDQYDGDERRAHQVAFASLKHTHEKVGDHWEPKDEYGPSGAQARAARTRHAPTAGGVDANATKQHLYELATRLDVTGRSTDDQGRAGRRPAEGQRPGNGQGASGIAPLAPPAARPPDMKGLPCHALRSRSPATRCAS